MYGLVSIVMPAYNASKLISYSIESVLNQSYQDWELIIVNDCSKDNTKELCESYIAKDSRIRLINLIENKGIYNARNTAIKNSKGKYLAFLDSDDLWKPDKLESQLEFMEKQDIAFSFTEYEAISENGEKLGKIYKVPKKVDYSQLLEGNVIGCLTVVINKEKISEIKMPKLKHEDYATWLSILKDNNISAFGLKLNLSSYRNTANSVSSNKLKTLAWTWNIYHNYLGYNKIKSLFLVLRCSINAVKKNL